MKSHLISPNPKRLQTLLTEIVDIVSNLSFVKHIYVFGSLVGDGWDRWSDIDMIIVTQCQSQFWDVWTTLNAEKPILHHHPLSRAEPSGVHILGNVFVDEAIFHCLDLNFFTMVEWEKPETSDRFGAMRELYHDVTVRKTSHDNKTCVTQELTLDEQQISIHIHFTKKAIKRILRRQENFTDLQKHTNQLKVIMQNYAFDYQVTGGNIGSVAKTYLSIADYLLKNQ